MFKYGQVLLPEDEHKEKAGLLQVRLAWTSVPSITTNRSTRNPEDISAQKWFKFLLVSLFQALSRLVLPGARDNRKQ